MIELTLHLPEEWKDQMLFAEPVASADDLPIAAAGGVLKDGTNWMGCAYPGGQRLVSMGPASDWKVTERFSGSPPVADDASLVDKLWRLLLDAMIAGRDQAAEELGGMR